MSNVRAFTRREFRDALGSYPTGVTVVATLDAAGEPRGFTANSFTSVSMEPPLLLVCLAKSAHSHPIFAQAGAFSINVLSDQQRDVSDLFASQANDKFRQVAWSPTDYQTPSIHGSLASFHCRKEQQIDAGDHTILIGHVQAFTTAVGNPLGYCRGAYVTHQSAASVEAAVRKGAHVGAIIETPQGIVMRKSKNMLALPSAGKLGTQDADSGLHHQLRQMGLDVTLDFVFSVYEDANNPCVVYRGRAPAAPATTSCTQCVGIDEIARLTASHTDPTTLSILQRFAHERRQDIHSIYVGNDKDGVVVALQPN